MSNNLKFNASCIKTKNLDEKIIVQLILVFLGYKWDLNLKDDIRYDKSRLYLVTYNGIISQHRSIYKVREEFGGRLTPVSVDEVLEC